MRKFIVISALLFAAGFTATAWASSAIGSGNKNPGFQSAGGVQSTQGDQNQVGEKLRGSGETQSGDHKNLFPKAQLGKRKFSSKMTSLDDKHRPGVKGKFDHKNEIGGKGKKGFLKGEKGFLKGEKGFLKGDKGKNSIILQGGKEGKPNEIDDEVTWGKNKGLDAKSPKGKGFLKYEGAGKPGAAGMPAVK